VSSPTPFAPEGSDRQSWEEGFRAAVMLMTREIEAIQSAPSPPYPGEWDRGYAAALTKVQQGMDKWRYPFTQDQS